MTAVGMVRSGDEHPAAERLFSSMEAKGLVVPNLYRVLAHSPALLEQWVALARCLLNSLEGLDPISRELAVLRVALVSECEYEWSNHARLGLSLGITTDQIENLRSWRKSALFGPPHRAALALVDEMLGTDQPPESALAAVIHEFGKTGAVELAVVIGFYAGLSKSISVLKITLD